MKTLLILSLCVPLIVGPAMAIPQKPMSPAEVENLHAKCAAGGGCFVVTEAGFKKAMVMAFERGAEHGAQVGYQFGLKACSSKGSI